MSGIQAPEVITDSAGRKITLRKLTVVDQARLLRAIGPKQAENQPYVQLVEMACMAADIDGIPLPFPTNETQIDALLGRLGDSAVNELYGARLAAIQKLVDEAEAAKEEKTASPLTVSGS